LSNEALMLIDTPVVHRATCAILARMNTDASIDVGAILAQLRAEVRAAQGLTDGEPADGITLGVDTNELRDAIAEVEALRAVSAHWPLTWRTPRERAHVFVQRLIRRGLRWYVAPIVEQQNAYNNAVARALELLLQSHEQLAAEVQTLKNKD
jgi:hypothetical protein